MRNNIDYITRTKEFLFSLPNTPTHIKNIWSTFQRNDIELWDKITFLSKETHSWFGGIFIITFILTSLWIYLFIIHKRNNNNSHLEKKIQRYLQNYTTKTSKESKLINTYQQDKKKHQFSIIKLILSQKNQTKKQSKIQKQIENESNKSLKLPHWVGIAIVCLITLPIIGINYKLILNNLFLLFLVLLLFSFSTQYTRNIAWNLFLFFSKILAFFLHLVFPSWKEEPKETVPIDEEVMIDYILETLPSYDLSEEDKTILKKLEQYKKEQTPHLVSRKKLEDYYFVISI